MTEPSLQLNWFGMAVHDVPRAAEFYGGILGFSYVENEAYGLWRYFQTQRMTFELFQAHPERPDVIGWGQGQAFRPVMIVPDISTTTEILQRHGIPLESDVSTQIEMTGPEGIRWALQERPTLEMDWAHPLIAGVELKAANLQAQKEFYTRILGMIIEDDAEQGIHLSGLNGEAWLRIVAGGQEASLRIGENQPAFFHPIWLSFETKSVKQVNARLQHQNVTILRPLIYHPDWLGTDILLADADGNVIQVVQYGVVDGLNDLV